MKRHRTWIEVRRSLIVPVILLAALVGTGSTLAHAGPSDHSSRPFGDRNRAGQAGTRTFNRSVTGPSALTGWQAGRRVLDYRDVPRGRGQTERIPFWIWVSE